MKQYAILFIFSLFSLAAFASDINLQIISSSAQIIPEKPWEEYPTLGQALQENSDLQINSYGEGGAEYLTIQGYNKGVQIYLDGAPLPMDITGITDISLIPTAIIERVEIVEGFNPASPQATGSVYIYTKKPIDNATVFDASAYTASNKTNLFSLGMRGSVFDKLPYQLSYSRNTSDGFQINSGYTKDAVNFKVEPFKNQTLSYIYLHSNIGLSGGTTTPIGQWDGEKEKTPVSTTDYMEDTLNQIAFNGQAGKFNYGAAYNNLDRQGENWGEVKIQNQDYFAFAEYALFDFLSLGSSYKHSQIHTNSSYYNKNAYYWNQTSAYAKAVIETALDFDLSARYDYHDYWHSNLSYGAKISKGKETKFYIAANVGNIYPSIADYDKHIGALKPENNYQFEAGIEGQYLDFNFKAAPYLRYIDDKINLINPLGSYEYFATNIGRARILGVDFEAVKTFGPYRATLLYSLMDNKIKPYGEGGYKTSQFAPKQVISFTNTLNIESWRFIAILFAKSNQYSGNDKTGDKLPGYADLEFTVEKKIAGAEIFATASNILDRHYAINGGYGAFYPCAGRTFKLGVRYQFSKSKP